jgi:hypothetical protein
MGLTELGGFLSTNYFTTTFLSPVKQFKNVTLSHSSCNLKMLPVAVGAVGMWKSGAGFWAGFPSAEGSVGNSFLFLEFSTLSSARHFHSASVLFFPRIRTRAPVRLSLAN